MIDAVLAAEVVERFGTPLYVYDASALRAQAASLRALLPPSADVLFSLKANPNPAVGRELRAEGCRAEISSPGELASGLAAGFQPGGMMYSGPAKSDQELGCALAAGVGWFSVESPQELPRLSRMCRRLGRRARVLLRLDTEVVSHAGLSMSGVGSRFGMSVADLDEAVRHLPASDPAFRLCGFHVYQGTQIRGVDALAGSFGEAVAVCEEASDRIGVSPEVLDLGGGFPWPYAADLQPDDLTELRARLETVLSARKRTARAAVWFESGRYLSAPAGTLVTRVVASRPVGGGQLVHLDAGINHLGGLGASRRVLPSQVCPIPLQPRPGESVPTALAGPLCTPADVLARNLSLPPLEAGDLLVVPNAGAYGASASLVAFLSRTPPIELMVHDGVVSSVFRLRSGFEELT